MKLFAVIVAAALAQTDDIVDDSISEVIVEEKTSVPTEETADRINQSNSTTDDEPKLEARREPPFGTVVENTDVDPTGRGYGASVNYNGNIDAFNNGAYTQTNSNTYTGNVPSGGSTYTAPAAPSYTDNSASSGTYSGQASQQQNANYQSSGGAKTMSCWSCKNAYSIEECMSAGYLETCQSNQESCELEIRERNGYIIQVHTGCKQKLACENNKAQNFQTSNPAYTQCRPEPGYTHSVCRQCCYDSSCVTDPDFWYPASREEWAY